MSDSIEIHALRDGFWDLISTYDASQEDIAIKEAANIYSGYAAIAVLSIEKMSMLYYKSLRNVPQPSYYEVRKSIKADRPKMKPMSMPAPKSAKKANTANTEPEEQVAGSGPAPHAPRPGSKAGDSNNGQSEKSFIEKLIESIIFILTGKRSEEKPTSTEDGGVPPLPGDLKGENHTLAGTADNLDSKVSSPKSIENLLEAHLAEEEKEEAKKKQEPDEEKSTEKTVENTAKAPSSKPDTKTSEKSPNAAMASALDAASGVSDNNPFKPKDKNGKTKKNPLLDSVKKEHEAAEKKAALKNSNTTLPTIGGGQVSNTAVSEGGSKDQERNTAFWNQISQDEDDFESARLQIKKSLNEAMERSKQLAWLPDQGMMRGTLQLATLLFICGIGRKLCSHVGIPGGIGNQVIAETLEHLGLSEKQAFICALHIDRVLSDHKNNLMYLIGRAYGANILNDSEQRIDLLSIFNAWEEDTLERFFEMDEESNTTKLSKLPYLKAISILLTDIVNFTGQSNEKGEKWVKDVIHAHSRMTKTITGHHSGELIQGTGDGVMLIFTAPQAAMHAALELQFMHQNFCRRVPSRHFDIRVAISHGIPVQTQSGLHGPAIEELNMMHKEMADNTIAVTKGIASIAEQHGFNFSLKEEAIFPFYEFTTYKGAHTVSNDMPLDENGLPKETTEGAPQEAPAQEEG